jgi:hypothetical protein
LVSKPVEELAAWSRREQKGPLSWLLIMLIE